MTWQREQAIQTVRTSLVHRVSPRMHMLGFVVVTGGAGFLASYAMLHAGVRSMAVRYPIAAGIGYTVFLGMVWLWLRRYRLTAKPTSKRERGGFDIDIAQLPFDELFSSAPDAFEGFGGGGGFSGGGGGSAWSGESLPTLHAVAPLPRAGGGTVSGGGGWDLDLDEGALWLIPIAIIAAIVLCVVAYVLFLAPTLFAELLLDAGLAAGLYRRLLRVERRPWLLTAVRYTVIPACFVAALLALAGTIAQGVYPDAASVGAVVHHLKNPPVDRVAR